MLTTLLENTIAALFITNDSIIIEEGERVRIITPKSACTIEIDGENGKLKRLKFHYHTTARRT